jgi:hypothetical protein
MIRAIAAAAALLAAGAAQAQTVSEALAQAARFERELCHGLNRLVEAAPDFTGLYDARPAPPWLGFRPGSCRAHEGSETLPASYWCHQNLAPAHLSLESLAAATAACLPQGKRERGEWGREAIFTLPEMRILISEHGAPGAHVGRIVGYRVEAVTAKAE